MRDPAGGPRLLIVSEDDDVAAPLEALLRRAGFRVGVRDGGGDLDDLRTSPPEVLILDRDLSKETRARIASLLAEHAGPRSFPIIVLGSGAEPPVPRDWHEDAWMSAARPPEGGEVLARIAALRRLAFYRQYRDLVHDLAQPVTSLHALSRSIAKLPVSDQASRTAIDRLVREADRLMTLLEEFQRKRAAGPAGPGPERGPARDEPA